MQWGSIKIVPLAYGVRMASAAFNTQHLGIPMLRTMSCYSSNKLCWNKVSKFQVKSLSHDHSRSRCQEMSSRRITCLVAADAFYLDRQSFPRRWERIDSSALHVVIHRGTVAQAEHDLCVYGTMSAIRRVSAHIGPHTEIPFCRAAPLSTFFKARVVLLYESPRRLARVEGLYAGYKSSP